MSHPSKSDLHAAITGSIVAAIEAGSTTCSLPWRRSGLPTLLPANAHTKAHYQGINIVALWVTAMRKGYAHGIWATYRQWAELGAQVRQGEKASPVIFYKEYTVETDASLADDDGRRRVARASSVFNIAQVDGYTPPEIELLPPIKRLALAETLTKATQADIRHGGDMAYYCMRRTDGSGDYIQMPDEGLFQAACEAQRSEDYYSVLLHELTHYAAFRIMPRRHDSSRTGRNHCRSTSA